MVNRIFTFCFFLILKNLSAQNKLADIEQHFLQRNIVIENTIRDSTIENNFELFKKITKRSFINHPHKISVYNSAFSEKTDYYNYHFGDSVNLNNVVFKEEFDFSLSKFFDFTIFHQSTFNKNAIFTWSDFKKDVTFSRSKFESEAIFLRAIFREKVDFFQSSFYEKGDFYGATFAGESNFVNAKFYTAAIFSFVQFDSDCSFRNAEFKELLTLNNSEINGVVDFSGAKFDSVLDFSGSTIEGALNFSNATLPQFLDLSNVISMKGEINLLETKSYGKFNLCKINLVNTDPSRIKLHYENFELWFPPNTGYEAKCIVYNKLLNSLKDHGDWSGAAKLDIEFQQYKYLYNRQFLKNYIQHLWWNYGYEKEKIFIWLFRIIIILTIVNSLFLKSLMETIYEMKFLNIKKVNERHALHNPVLTFFLNIPTGFTYTIILLVGGAFGIKFNSDQIRFPNFFGMLYIISVGLLGLSCSAFILNFIFKL